MRQRDPKTPPEPWHETGRRMWAVYSWRLRGGWAILGVAMAMLAIHILCGAPCNRYSEPLGGGLVILIVVWWQAGALADWYLHTRGGLERTGRAWHGWTYEPRTIADAAEQRRAHWIARGIVGTITALFILALVMGWLPAAWFE